MTLPISITIVLITSIIIYYTGKHFAEASSNLGDYLGLPRSVKGATFDAIASSLPELLVALFSVIFFLKFEVGIGTIAGSALFNLLIIPGICVLVSPKIFQVSKKVITRDALFYIISVFILLVILLYFKTWGIIIALLLLITYAFYLKKIVKDSREYHGPKKSEINLTKELSIFTFAIIIIGITTYLLTKHSIQLSHLLGISPILIAFTITAAATSIPDTVISYVNAKKGDLSDATSNVFGSNIFDICIGLGFPLLIYSILKGPVQIIFNNLEIILGLLGSTILVLYFMADDHKLTKKEGISLLLMYFVFLIYIILLSLNAI